MSFTSIFFTAPVDDGGLPILTYSAISTPGNIVVENSMSPIFVDGLTPGVEYFFTVSATNLNGKGPESSPSNFFTPPLPTYSLVANKVSVNEGNSVVISLITTEVNNGTLVPYNITSISSADISGASLTGNFNVNNNTAAITFDIAADGVLEGTETMSMTVNSANVSVIINDTSTLPEFTNYPNITTIPFGVNNASGFIGPDVATFTFNINNASGFIGPDVATVPLTTVTI